MTFLKADTINFDKIINLRRLSTIACAALLCNAKQRELYIHFLGLKNKSRYEYFPRHMEEKVKEKLQFLPTKLIVQINSMFKPMAIRLCQFWKQLEELKKDLSWLFFDYPAKIYCSPYGMIDEAKVVTEWLKGLFSVEFGFSNDLKILLYYLACSVASVSLIEVHWQEMLELCCRCMDEASTPGNQLSKFLTTYIMLSVAVIKNPCVSELRFLNHKENYLRLKNSSSKEVEMFERSIGWLNPFAVTYYWNLIKPEGRKNLLLGFESILARFTLHANLDIQYKDLTDKNCEIDNVYLADILAFLIMQMTDEEISNFYTKEDEISGILCTAWPWEELFYFPSHELSMRMLNLGNSGL